MEFLEILKAIFLGIVEGITEWLPVSSTGHMILFDEFITLNVSEAFKEMFFVVIQLGAILAVPVLFWNKLNPFSETKNAAEKKNILSLWCKVIVGCVPAAVLGILLDDILDEYLYTPWIVAAALVIYGVAFILVERYNISLKYFSSKKAVNEEEICNDKFRVENVYDLSYKDALTIGAFQVLSLIPGTSRSGSTILGGMLSGVSRTASAEFSFFMAIPVMLGASGLKILKFLLEGFRATSLEIWILVIGIIVSFLVSLAVIKFLMDFVKRHSFSAFGVYRIILGVVVIGYFLIRLFI